MKPVNFFFEGCGSYDNNIKAYLEKEFLDLNGMLKSLIIIGKSNKNEVIKPWLIAFIAKTIKEDVNSSILITFSFY
jgi:hypothetical protein